MNVNRQFKFLILASFTILISISSIETFASNNTRQIILTGKVTNSETGAPVANHEVCVVSESITSKNASYFKILATDEEGFYYDTISTTLNKGSVQVYTYDWNDKMFEKKLYFRFIELRNSNIFVADFSIFMPYQPAELQANFKYFLKNANDRFTYQFVDLTENEYVNSWQWDFGDGSESDEQNPEHTFKATGLYKVKLTVMAELGRMQKISSYSTFIYVSKESYYHLGGHCFAGYFPIDMGKAYLFYIDKNQKFIPIDTSSFDTLGYYYFYEIPEGEYCIKTQPQTASAFYGEMIPTYYGDNVFWEKATHISHHQTNWEYDIHLVEGFEPGEGNCSISGNVAYGDTLNKNRISPAEGIDFYLLKEDGTLLTSRYSDDIGNFEFDNIETGKYKLTADIPGYTHKNKLIELNEENPEVSNIEILIENGDINMAYENELASNSILTGNLFPNPASDMIKMEISVPSNSDWVFEVIDTQGKKLQSQTVELQKGNSIVSMNVSTLKNGNYILLIKNKGQITGRPFIVNR